MTDITSQDFTCPLCGSQHKRLLKEIDSFGYPLRYYLCGNCGFVFQNAAESQAADPAFYQEAYRKIYQATEEPTAKDLRQQSLRANNQLEFIQPRGVCRVQRILDIGASSGTLLATLKKAFNADAFGVEPGNAYRELAQQKGLEMYASVDQLLKTKPEKFDLISMMHVLEHLEDPLAMLNQIRTSLLDPQGFLLLEVPNFFTHNSYELAHLSCFTEHTLRQLLLKAGFEIWSLRKHGYPRSQTLPLYITVLARPIEEAPENYAVAAEHGVAFKRFFGVLRRKIFTKLIPAKTWLPLEG